MHFLFVPVGTHGDVHPSVAMALALRERGHKATIATNEHYRALVEGVGLKFAPIGEPMRLRDALQTPGVMGEYFATLRLLRALVLPHLARGLHDLDVLLASTRPDVLVAHPLSIGAPAMCAKHGVRLVRTALAPIAWWNHHDALVVGPHESVHPGRWRVRMHLAIGRVVTRWGTDAGINAALREVGLPTGTNHFLDLCAGGAGINDLNLGLWSEHFRATLPGDPPGATIVGFPWFDRVRHEEDDLIELQRFLDDGEPPVVVTLGTAGVHLAGDFYSTAAGVCAALGQRALLLVNQRDYAPATLPQGVRAFTYAPYSMVFPRAKVIITSAGIGSTAQALRSGRPSLLIPFGHDQFDNASRVARLGAGTRLRHTQCTSGRLNRRLTQLLSNASFEHRARELAPHIAAQNGAGNAADLLARL